jgi:hypothetical protein
MIAYWFDLRALRESLVTSAVNAFQTQRDNGVMKTFVTLSAPHRGPGPVCGYDESTRR